MPPLIGRFVPFVAVAVANAINIPLMRQRELRYGIPVVDEEDERLGMSKVDRQTDKVYSITKGQNLHTHAHTHAHTPSLVRPAPNSVRPSNNLKSKIPAQRSTCYIGLGEIPDITHFVLSM